MMRLFAHVARLATAALLSAALLAPAASARPVLDGPALRVAYEDPRLEGRAREALAIVGELREEVTLRVGAPPPDPVELKLAASDREFDRDVAELSRGGAPPSWAIAVAIPQAGAIVVRGHRLELLTWNDLRPTLLHELSHLAVSDAAMGRLPRWLDEGLALRAEGRTLAAKERTALQRLARGGDLPTIAELSRGFPAHAEEAQLAYLLSLALVERIDAGAVPQDWTRLYGLLRRGMPFDRAFVKAFDQPAEGIEIVFREELAKAYSLPRDVWESSTIITFCAVLVLIAYVRWRRRRRALLAEMDAREVPEGE